ncbi:MAG: hypothetical protein K2X27_05975 [Candidatus Obscuribacterales bacterium]|nr:hypothetical protein [Candidatus Obscuribacterales bacterium]
MESKQISVVQRIVLNKVELESARLDELEAANRVRDVLKERYLESLSGAFPEAEEIKILLTVRLISEITRSKKALINVYGGLPVDELKVSEVLDYTFRKFESSELDELLS